MVAVRLLCCLILAATLTICISSHIENNHEVFDLSLEGEYGDHLDGFEEANRDLEQLRSIVHRLRAFGVKKQVAFIGRCW